MGDVAVIIPAAGDSRRFRGFKDKKPFVDLNGRPVWQRTVEHFERRQDVVEVVLVLSAADIDEFKERFRPNLTFLNVKIVAGGATRAESVQNGLRSLTSTASLVAVHDAARPLLTAQWITSVFAAARQHHAVIPAIPVSSTVKKVDDEGRILQTVDRSQLVLAQTPQVFARQLLEDAYQQAEDPATFTDEASLVEATGQTVRTVPGWPMNLKITTADDYRLAQILVDALPASSGLAELDPFAS